MRKVRVTLQPGSEGKKFSLFPSQEALYVWACALEKGETVQIDGIEDLVLDQGSFIEAELIAFEYIYDSKTSMKNKRLDFVRMGKANKPANAAGLQVSTHSGWVTGNMFPMKQYSDAHIDVKPIAQADAELDLSKLFHDDIEDKR